MHEVRIVHTIGKNGEVPPGFEGDSGKEKHVYEFRGGEWQLYESLESFAKWNHFPLNSVIVIPYHKKFNTWTLNKYNNLYKICYFWARSNWEQKGIKMYFVPSYSDCGRCFNHKEVEVCDINNFHEYIYDNQINYPQDYKHFCAMTITWYKAQIRLFDYSCEPLCGKYLWRRPSFSSTKHTDDDKYTILIDVFCGFKSPVLVNMDNFWCDKMLFTAEDYQKFTEITNTIPHYNFPNIENKDGMVEVAFNNKVSILPNRWNIRIEGSRIPDWKSPITYIRMGYKDKTLMCHNKKRLPRK